MYRAAFVSKLFCGFQPILSVRERLFVVVLNGSCGFAFVVVLFTEKGSSCVWHVLGWLGWCASFDAVNNQDSVAPRCFTLFHVLCMLFKLFRSFHLFKSSLLCTFFGWCFWVVTRKENVVLSYLKLI